MCGFVQENEVCFKAVLMKFQNCNYVISLKCFLCYCFHFKGMNISDLEKNDQKVYLCLSAVC